MAKIVSEEHDLDNIRVEEAAILAKIASGLPGSWDAAEYGITQEAAAQMLKEADTPQKRAEVMKELKARAVARAGYDTTGGKVRMFAAGEPPWAGLGVLVDGAANSKEALGWSGMDFTVELWNSFAAEPGATIGTVPDPETRHIVRTDNKKVLKAVGTSFEPFQNVDAFAFMDALVGEKLAMYETAGSLNGGKQVWILARIPKTYYAMPNDETKVYTLLVNYHGGGALKILGTAVRTVCQNTVNMAPSHQIAQGQGRGRQEGPRTRHQAPGPVRGANEGPGGPPGR